MVQIEYKKNLNSLIYKELRFNFSDPGGKIGFFQEAGGNCLYSEDELGRYLEDNRVEADGSL